MSEKPCGAGKSRRNTGHPAQLGLFDMAEPALAAARSPRTAQPTPRGVAERNLKQRRVEVRQVSVADLPAYPKDLVASVDSLIKGIPTDRVLLTYREIQDYFGVSRATVLRRLRDGLVPGVRIAEGRVLDDGPVRRLDRMQVRWLLLAVRYRAGAT